jgi:general secretion pathway protein B
MSYILDALKKAESERKLSSISNIHPPSAPNAIDYANIPGRRIWLMRLLVLLIFIIAIVGVTRLQPWWSRPPEVLNLPHNVTRPTAQTSGNPVPLTPSSDNEPIFSSANNAPDGAGLPEKNSVPALHVTKNIGPKRANLPKPAANSQPILEPAVSKIVPKPADVHTVRPPPESAQVEEKTVGTLQQLPENIQRELPAVVVNGYIYAKNAADRSVLINKKLLREGDQIGPELVLEKMTPSGAILNYRGYRYQISY